MSTLTIRLPDEKHERLKALALKNDVAEPTVHDARAGDSLGEVMLKRCASLHHDVDRDAWARTRSL